MQAAKRDIFHYRPSPVITTHTIIGSPRRQEAESFIRSVFAHHYGADVSAFAPNLLLLEQNDRTIAATGWRAASDESLFLERYLDQPIEQAMAKLAGQPVARERIVVCAS